MEGLSADAVKEVLRRCDALYSEAKFEESLALASAPENQKGPTELLPYVLEMQIRNMMALLQFQTALKLLDEVLKYLPNLRDFLHRKVECEIALGKIDEAQKTISDMLKKMESESTGEDSTWKQRLEGLRKKLSDRKTRDLTKIRVRFAEDVEMASEKTSKKQFYTFSQTSDSVDVIFFSKTKQSASEIRVDILPRQIKVGFQTVEDKTFQCDIDLYSEILPKKSTFDIKDGEVSLQLAKKDAGKSWPELELVTIPQEGAAKAGLTHTKRPWHEICKFE
jgi:tetratricopeptide (TPR) repeat protein